MITSEVDEKEIEEARKILGKVAENMTDEEIKDQVTKIKFLTESWLDEFERATFEGKTLEEVLIDRQLSKYKTPNSEA